MKQTIMLWIGIISLSSCQSTTDESVRSTDQQEIVEVQSTIEKLITPNELVEIKKNNPEVVVIDVRTPGEIAQGYIEGSKIIDYNSRDFKQQLQKLDKSKTYIMYCAVGGRSGNAQSMMKKMGFGNVANLKGGIVAWQNEGLPLVKK